MPAFKLAYTASICACQHKSARLDKANSSGKLEDAVGIRIRKMLDDCREHELDVIKRLRGEKNKIAKEILPTSLPTWSSQII